LCCRIGNGDDDSVVVDFVVDHETSCVGATIAGRAKIDEKGIVKTVGETGIRGG